MSSLRPAALGPAGAQVGVGWGPGAAAEAGLQQGSAPGGLWAPASEALACALACSSPTKQPVLPPVTRMILANGCPSVCCSQQSGGWRPRSRAEGERAAQVAQSRALPSDGHPASTAWPRFLRASRSESVIYYEDPPGRRSDQGPLTVSPKFRSHPSPSLCFRFLLLLLFA